MKKRAASERAALERALRRARLVLLWEQIWPAIAGMGAVIAAFLAVSFAGLWEISGPVGRIIGLALFAGLMALAARPLLKLHRPRRTEALARLDTHSAMSHRPATALDDHLATQPEDPVSRALWQAHMARARSIAHRLRAGLPSPGMARHDPYGLRGLALVALAATFFMAPGEHLSRLRAAFDWRGFSTTAPSRLDAWVDPPHYTGRPPVLLPGLRADDGNAAAQTEIAEPLAVPAGSTLVVRGTGLTASAIHLSGEIVPAEERADTPQDGALRFIIRGDSEAALRAPDGRHLSWRFTAPPDLPPQISFIKPPQPGQRHGLQLNYRVEDEYGVAQAEARFSPLPPQPGLFPRPGSTPPEMPEAPLVAPPDFTLPLPAGRRSGTVETTKDLVAHPWAGAMVRITLHARDAAGHEAVSETRTLRLPERPFTDPTARALIDERRRLALDPDNRRRLVAVLRALTTAPARFEIPTGEYLGLRTALARAKYARNNADLRDLVDYLWGIAVQIEDGKLTDAERALIAAQQALREGLEQGASDEEIARLMDNLRKAMAQMMQQLSRQAQHSDGADRPLDQNTRIVTQQDLQRMMDQMENLARSGNREAARQLLNQLQAMMESLRQGNPQASRQKGQQGELGAMIQQQQRLRDRTWKEQQGQGQQPQPEQPQQGEAPPSTPEDTYRTLQQEQQALRERLDKMRDILRRLQQGPAGAGENAEQGEDSNTQDMNPQDMNPQGMARAMKRAGEAFKDASEAMREAEDALGQSDAAEAQTAQGEALQSLRQGAQALAEGQRGQNGQNAQGNGTDPLGRPLQGGQGSGDDQSVKVPDEFDAQRARRVLEELRRRLEQPDRPQPELDYLERLLNGL
ncbi:TIGR02302 family protein [Xanthobacter sp. TB0139]|uniref:TIGR02302 family protein n=1 Tax=Xanthobacter sp. TB0139 TaxID=3459178 RepID=UPI00403A44B8